MVSFNGQPSAAKPSKDHFLELILLRVICVEPNSLKFVVLNTGKASAPLRGDVPSGTPRYNNNYIMTRF